MGVLLKYSMLSLCNARMFAFEQDIPECHRQYMGALLKDSMSSLCNARMFALEQNIPENHRQYGCFAQRFNVFPMQCKNVCI